MMILWIRLIVAEMVTKQSYLEYVVKTEIRTPNRLNTQTKNF